jgi:hypothetical protein
MTEKQSIGEDPLLADAKPDMSLFLKALPAYGDKIKRVRRTTCCWCPTHSYLYIDPVATEAAAHEADIEIEAENFVEGDAGYVSDTAISASTSIKSSVRNHAFENGTQYHKFRKGFYHFPNDEPEQEREDMKHAMIVNLCGGKLHYAPLENP